MDVIYERCCGLDIHKKTVVACVLISRPGRPAHKELRTFETMTGDLLDLADWLTSHGVTHVAMESTGVYWKPVWNLLEDSFTLLLVNAQHVKAVPGRKTDVKDAEWLADLLRHGLLRGSFVPDRPQREVRELTRYRTSLVRERATAINRIQKTLEGANIKLASVATDILGKSGRQMLEALVLGSTDASELAQLAKGRLRDKLPQLERALAGRFGPHQRSRSGCALLRQPWSGSRPFRGSGGGWPKSSSAKSVWTYAGSLRPPTWPPGPGCVRGSTKVPANGPAAGPAGAIRTCELLWWKRLKRRPIPRPPTWRLNSIG